MGRSNYENGDDYTNTEIAENYNTSEKTPVVDIMTTVPLSKNKQLS